MILWFSIDLKIDEGRLMTMNLSIEIWIMNDCQMLVDSKKKKKEKLSLINAHRFGS